MAGDRRKSYIKACLFLIPLVSYGHPKEEPSFGAEKYLSALSEYGLNHRDFLLLAEGKNCEDGSEGGSFKIKARVQINTQKYNWPSGTVVDFCNEKIVDVDSLNGGTLKIDKFLCKNTVSFYEKTDDGQGYSCVLKKEYKQADVLIPADSYISFNEKRIVCFRVFKEIILPRKSLLPNKRYRYEAKKIVELEKNAPGCVWREGI